MPTIIDSLVVTLGLDSSGFQKHIIDVNVNLSALEKQAVKTEKKTASLGQQIAKFLALIGGTVAIKRFVSDMVNSDAALNRFSQNIMESANTISAMGKAAELTGGSAESLQGTLDMLGKAQTDLMLTGESSLIPYFSALGLSMTDMYGKALPVSELLLNIGQALMEKAPDRQTAYNMGRNMGIDSGTLNMILRARKEAEAMIGAQKQFNAATKEQVETASRLETAFIKSRQGFESFGRELLYSAAPAIEKFFQIMEGLGSWMRDNQEFITAFLVALTAGLVGIGVAITPINLVAVAILGVAAAIAALWQDYQVWKRGGESLIPWAKWEPGIKSAIDGLRELKEMLADVLYVAVAGGDALVSLAKGDFAGAKIAAKAFWEGRERPETPTASAPMGNDRGRFVSSASRLLGVPEAVVDAHLRSETGVTGRSTIGDYNYGNIKAGKSWAGASKSSNVLEYDANGNPRTESAAFRSYGSPEAAAADYAALIRNRYPGAAGASSAEEYARALKAGGYATDPDYVSKIARIGRGIPGASSFAAGASAPAAARAQMGMVGGPVSSSVDTKIGEIKVFTNATDATGIARDMGNAMDFLFTSQFNSGLTP